MDTRRLTTPLMRDNTIVTAHTTRSHGAHHDTHAGMHPMRACNTCRTHAALVNVEVGAERSAAARKACDEPKKCASTLKNAKGSVAQISLAGSDPFIGPRSGVRRISRHHYEAPSSPIQLLDPPEDPFLV